MQKRYLKKFIPLALLAAIVCTGTQGALNASNGVSAFFNKKQSYAVTSKAGTLQLKLTDNTENHNLDPDNDGIINPGDYKNIRFNVANTAEKSMDLRAVLTLKSASQNIDKYSLVDHVNLSQNSANAQHPAVESTVSLKDSTGNVKLIEECNLDKHTKRYTVELGTLNGSVETEDGITNTADDYSMQFYFDRLSPNSYIGDNVTLDYTVYGIQHRNAQDSDQDNITPLFKSVSVDTTKFSSLTNRNEHLKAIKYSSDPAPANSTEIGANGDSLKAKVVNNELLLYTDANQIRAVGDFSDTFGGCTNLTDISALSNQDMSNVKTMKATFYGCSSLEDISALSDWNVSSVTTMESIFSSCSSITDVSSLEEQNTSAVTTMSYAFANCIKLADLTGLRNQDVSSVKVMDQMFKNCSSLTNLEGLNNQKTDSLTDIGAMFHNCINLTDVSALKDWNTLTFTSIEKTFEGCSNLSDVSPLNNWDIRNVRNLQDVFQGTKVTKNPSWRRN